MSLSVLYYFILRFSLSLLQFQPISVWFVTISAVLSCCFNAMSLVGIIPLSGSLHISMYPGVFLTLKSSVHYHYK